MSDDEETEVLSGTFYKKIDNEIPKCCVFDGSSENGISWKIQFSTELAPFDSFNKIDRCLYVMWKFEWDEEELKKQGYDGYEGEVFAIHLDHNNQNVRRQYNVELIHSGLWMQRRFGTEKETNSTEPKWGSLSCFVMEFSLKKFSFEAKNVSSDINDSVLIVKGNKINVNKKYLSMHSEYFNKMFNSEFKEKSMPEIPINDVNYADFSRLLNTIHPTHPVLPTDENIEILLDLADRFMVPVVTERVINHLRYSSDLPFEEFLRIAEKYKMDKLWELILKPINSGPRMQLLTKNIKCKELSETARLKLFSHFADIINSSSFVE